MSKVLPKVFMVGATSPDMFQIRNYLEHTKQQDFVGDWLDAIGDDVNPAECMISLFAKLCYSSVVPGRNDNIERTRSIADNLLATFRAGHGSVFEHVTLNFIITDCSRVFTHELVRHRAGTAFSQTSGRYVRLDKIDVIWDPILDGCEDILFPLVSDMEEAIYLAECRKGLREPPPGHALSAPGDYIEFRKALQMASAEEVKWVPTKGLDFSFKKKVTSALRRFAPNGQSNEIAFSVNLTALRHCIMMRTAAGAEWEIRYVFEQIYRLTAARYAYLYPGAVERQVDGALEVSGLRLHPYEIQPGDPNALHHWSEEQLHAELKRRSGV